MIGLTSSGPLENYCRGQGRRDNEVNVMVN